MANAERRMETPAATGAYHLTLPVLLRQLAHELGALQLMAARGAAVAHCPLSNFYFGDGLFCVARALAALCGVPLLD